MKYHVIIMVALTLVAIGIGGACGTTFTAGQGQITTMSLKTSSPGKAVIKIDKDTACTVNASGPLTISNPCGNGEVPWYNGIFITCLLNPCPTGKVLMHNPDGTVSCQ